MPRERLQETIARVIETYAREKQEELILLASWPGDDAETIRENLRRLPKPLDAFISPRELITLATNIRTGAHPIRKRI